MICAINSIYLHTPLPPQSSQPTSCLQPLTREGREDGILLSVWFTLKATESGLDPWPSALSPSQHTCSSLPTAKCLLSSLTLLSWGLFLLEAQTSDSQHTSSHGRLPWAQFTWSLVILHAPGGQGSNLMRNLGRGPFPGVTTKVLHLHKPPSAAGMDPRLYSAVTSWVSSSLTNAKLRCKQSSLCFSLRGLRMSLPLKKRTFLLTIKLRWVTLL